MYHWQHRGISIACCCGNNPRAGRSAEFPSEVDATRLLLECRCGVEIPKPWGSHSHGDPILLEIPEACESRSDGSSIAPEFPHALRVHGSGLVVEIPSGRQKAGSWKIWSSGISRTSLGCAPGCARDVWNFQNLPGLRSRLCKGGLEFPSLGVQVVCLGQVPFGISRTVRPTNAMRH